MGTITRRERKDGSASYTAQVRITRGGKLAFSQAATFDREATARAWLKRKEKELAAPGALEAARKGRSGTTIADLIDRYLATSRRRSARPRPRCWPPSRSTPSEGARQRS